MIVSARKNELPTARITLRAIGPTNSPAPPGMSAMGAKAMQVVSVEPNSGTARCRTAPDTASAAGAPPARRWRTSSTTTIALSISRPRAMIIPVTDIWCSGMPRERSPWSTISVVSGNAVPTRTAARQPIVKTITTITSMAPSRKFVTRSARRSFV